MLPDQEQEEVEGDFEDRKADPDGLAGFHQTDSFIAARTSRRVAVLYIAPVVNGTVSAYSPAPNASGTGNAFVYQKRQYQVDLDTRALAAGVWRLRTVVNGAIMNEVNITLQK